MLNVEVRGEDHAGRPASHFIIQHSVFMILRFPLPATGVVPVLPKGPALPPANGPPITAHYPTVSTFRNMSASSATLNGFCRKPAKPCPVNICVTSCSL